MILAGCLNPAIDVTYHVAAHVPGQSHRVLSVTRRAGGKGVNVARVVRQLGEPVLVTGLLGGPTGAAIAADLAA
ncbi:MAG TPA: PfkB family carbohydrate kinase, partial [Jatrophihabitans sp.]|nr:PfkB family carbohydrate kinase [Jatrophihabitans sp.]